jgi:hypothetical protein
MDPLPNPCPHSASHLARLADLFPNFNQTVSRTAAVSADPPSSNNLSAYRPSFLPLTWPAIHTSDHLHWPTEPAAARFSSSVVKSLQTSRLSRQSLNLGETIPRKSMEALTRHPWPGNIRELQNVMERAVLLSSGRSLRVPLNDIVAPLDLKGAGDGSAIERVEREMILQALRESNWVVGGARGAAARLRLNRTGPRIQNEEVWNLAPNAAAQCSFCTALWLKRRSLKHRCDGSAYLA